MSRAASGPVQYIPPRADEAQGHYKARITLTDGSRPWFNLPPSPKSPEAEHRARATAAHKAEQWRSKGVVRVSNGTPAPAAGETVSQWAERWIADRETRGILSYHQDEGRLANHVLPTLGPLGMVTVGRDDVERLVEVLDAKVRDGELAPKTAANVWTLVTSMFDDACRSKTRALRCRSDNPTRDVRGPERGVDRSKTYLYPSEFLRLVSAPEDKVPRRFRDLYACAVYSYARAGELEALEPGDVDLDHAIISITKAVDRRNGEVKSTKTGESRRIPIEPNLFPLLRRLKNECTGERLLWVPKADERATSLRDHLRAVGVDRPELFADNDRQKHLTFHDLRRTALTWLAVRGDDPLRIKQRAGHSAFSTTEGYLVEVETLAAGFGEPFPPLPAELTGEPQPPPNRLESSTGATPKGPNHAIPESNPGWSKGGSNP